MLYFILQQCDFPHNIETYHHTQNKTGFWSTNYTNMSDTYVWYGHW